MKTEYLEKVNQFFKYVGNPNIFEDITILMLIYDYNGKNTDGIWYLLKGFENELRYNLSQIESKDNQESHLIHITRQVLQRGNFWFVNKPEKEILNKFRKAMPVSHKDFFKGCSAYEKYIIMAYNVYDSIGRFIKIICKDHGIDSYQVYVKAERERDFFTDDEITDANQRRYQEAIHEEAERAVKLKEKREKIKWLGTPSQFAFVFSEFINQGYIEPPHRKNLHNYAALSRLCFDAFDIDCTPGTLERVFTAEGGSLSEFNRGRFIIPPLNQIK